VSDELPDDRRAELLEGAQSLLQELRRQQRAGYDSWERFGEDRDRAKLIIEQEAELRARRAADLTVEDLATLRFAADIVRDSDLAAWVTSAPNPASTKERALAVLDRLLAVKP
jgi:hypothetical protein